MRTFVVSAALAALTFLSAHPAFAQTGEELKALSKEIEALKQGQKSIQSDLQELKTLLRARPAPAQPQAAAAPAQEAVLSVDGAPFKGEKNAKLTLVDFTDYQ